MESVFLCVGLIFQAIVLAVPLRDEWPFITRPLLSVEGEVVRHDKTFSEGDDVWRAAIAFTDEEGTRREALDLMLFETPSPISGHASRSPTLKAPPTRHACNGCCCARFFTECSGLWRWRWSGSCGEWVRGYGRKRQVCRRWNLQERSSKPSFHSDRDELQVLGRYQMLNWAKDENYE